MNSSQGNPSWPSLYNVVIELAPIAHRDAVQPHGKYLNHPEDIYHFILYWTILFYTPAFVVCGLYAFLNVTFPPSRARPRSHRNRPHAHQLEYTSYAPVPTTSTEIPMDTYSRRPDHGKWSSSSKPRLKQNERRSRLTFALLVLLLYLVCAIAGAVIGSAIIGYVLVGLFKAAKYNMSTWIPFCGGLIQALVACLGLWPTVIDII